MKITESQLRLIVRQELLEVLSENNVNLLDEGFMDKIRNLGAAGLIGGTLAGAGGAALGTAGMQYNQALPGEAAHQQILHTVASAELSNQEIGSLEELTKKYLESVNKTGSVATHNASGMKFDATTKMLTYKGKSIPVGDEIIQSAKKYLTLSKSGKHSKAGNFLGSPEGKKLIQQIDTLVKQNPNLNQAVAVQNIQNVSLAIATMSLIMSLIIAVLGADVTTNDRRR